MKKHVLVLTLAALLLSACGKQEEPVAAPTAPAPVVAAAPAAPVLDAVKVLNIYNWPDYIPEGMIAAFEQETGIQVNYDSFESNEALHAKLVAGGTGYDIVVPGTGFAQHQIAAGFFQPLDKAKIPNLANLDPEFMKKVAVADPGNQFLVPWAWGFTTVGINRQKVERALGATPIPENSWELVFNPTYTRKLRGCGIIMLDSPHEIMPVALHYVGKPAFSSNPADFQLAAEMLAKVRPDIRRFSNTMIDDIAGGEACVFVGWSGDINIAAGRVLEKGGTDQIVPLLPSTGGLLFVDAMAITKDARHPNNAHAFINFYLRAENAARMANEMNYPTGNKAALALIRPEIKNNTTIFLGEQDTARLIPAGGFALEVSGVLNDTYNAFKRGR